MIRALAHRIARHAAAVIAPIRPTQADAVLAEIASIERSSEALLWAMGCVAASYRQRARLVTLASFTFRLGTGLACASFGLTHIMLAGVHPMVKLELMHGMQPAVSRHHQEVVAGLPLEHWLLHFALLGGIGVLHLFAAGALLAGQTRHVHIAALMVSAIALSLPLFGHGGLTFPAIYVGLVGLMSLAATGMARVERWDNARA
jgi:hypothetical protein